jgi:glycolate oxidase FAD binding subunit
VSASSTDPAGSQVIVLYDGVCGLCNRLVRFLLKRDQRDHFRFAALQSAFAQQALARHGVPASDLHTVFVITNLAQGNERVFRKSAAVIEIARSIGGLWNLVATLRILPRSLADSLYDLVARHRYQLFGKYDTCPLPNPGEREKFLELGKTVAEAFPPVNVVTELARICGEEHVLHDAAAVQAWAIGGIVPQAVVEPGSADEIAAILKFATAHRLAVVPAGGLTHLHVGAAPGRLDIVLRTSRLNTIEVGDHEVCVGAGAAVHEVTIRLAERGAWIPIEAEDESTVGGVLAVAAEGPLRQGCGGLAENCVAMTLVTGDGTIGALPGAVPPQFAGFDPIKLMVGSYGGLGVIVSASLKVFPRPEQTRTLVAKFLLANGALQFRDRVLRSALRPLCLELASPRASEFLDRPEQTWNLYIRLAGDSAALVGYRADLGGETYVKEELAGEAEAQVWQGFSRFEEITIRRHANAMIVHVSVPTDRVAQAIHAAEKIATANNFLSVQVGSVGLGSLIMVFVPLGAPITTQYVKAASALGAALAPEGSFVIARCPAEVKPLVEVWGSPEGEIEALRRAKRIMDPGGILNPGRFALLF